MPILVPLSQNTTVNQTQYIVQHTLNGTSFVTGDAYYVTVEGTNTAGSTNVTSNSTTVCLNALRLCAHRLGERSSLKSGMTVGLTGIFSTALHCLNFFRGGPVAQHHPLRRFITARC